MSEPVAAGGAERGAAAAVRSGENVRPRVFPMSFAQARLWVLDRFTPGDPAYNVPAVTRLQGWIHTGALERAVNEIVRRHESLRTTFRIIDGRPSQVVAPSLEIPLEVIDLRAMPPGPERDARLGEVVYEESRRPFDLANGPLLRVGLARLDVYGSVLILVMHHIVSDGWSSTVLFRELAALYTAFLARRPSPLPELPLQYADYAQWQNVWLTGRRLEQQLGYWRRQLAGLRPVLDLPTDRPRPPVQSHRGALRVFRVDEEVLGELKKLSQQQSATLFMTLLAAFKVLLHRLSGETDVAVGIPIANRTRAEFEHLIGFFVNTLVLRTDLSGDPTFGELIQREREVALAAYDHQDLPFEKLVEELEPQRNLEHNPLFQIMFAVQNIGVVENVPAQAAAAAQVPGLGNGTAKFDLTLSLQDQISGADGFLEFNTDLFDPETVDRMIERYLALLAAVGGHAERPISELPIGVGSDREEDLDGWAGPAEPEDVPATVLAAVERHARERPETAALLTADVELGYRELAARAGRFARGLRSAGVPPRALVGIALPTGPEAVIAILGTLAAGCRYLPLEAAAAEDGAARLAALARRVAEAQGPVLVVGAAAQPVGAPPVLAFDELDGAGADADEDGTDAPASAADVACVVARPVAGGGFEGVPLSHGDLLASGRHPAVRLEPGDRVALASHPASDAGRFELFATLAVGAAVVPLPDAAALPPRRLATLLRDLEVTAMFASPRRLGRLARDFPWALRTVRLLLDDSRLTDWGAVRGALPAELVARAYTMFGDPGVGGFFAVQRLAALAPAAPAIPVGEPVAGMKLHVLDAHGRPVPPGVPGELHVERAGARRRTGESVRRLPGPALELRRRPDGRVRAGGLGIDPTEIEAALREHPSVEDAAVGPRPGDGLGEPALAALYVAAGAETPEAELAAYLGERLPAAIVPARFAAVESLPCQGGALDRRAVADTIAALDDPAARAEPYLEPRNDLEATLVQVWMDTLAIERIGVRDNFFRLGGHSLLATQAVARIGDTFQVDLPLQQLFENPTVEKLARVIEPLVSSDQPAEARAINRVPRDRAIPLSFAQQRLWFLDQFEPDSAFYNIALPVRLPGAIDEVALEAALNDLVERHETLRTTFRMVDGQPRQVIAPTLRLELPPHDLRRLPAEERQREAERLTREELSRPFDLQAGPVLRAQLVRLADADHLLLASVHHIAADGWSTDILFRELTAFYEARRTGRPANLPELPVQYADFACWQRRWLSGTRLEAHLAYWRGQLEGAPALLELPTDRPRPAIQTFTGGMITTALPASLLKAVRELSNERGTTLFTTLLAAFKLLLHRYTGSDDVVIGTPIANRTRPELEGLIGFFANTLVLRTRLAEAMTFHDLLARVHAGALEAYAHQDIPFERLVEELQPERSLAYNPLFQVMFALQNIGRPAAGAAAPAPAANAPAEGAPPVIGAGVAKFDLTIFVTEVGNRLDVGIEYNTDLFDEPTIRRLVERYEALLRAALAEPEAPIGTLSLLTADESLTLAKWNQTAAPTETSCVHRRFEAQAERTPEADALRLGGRSLSYRELDRRADAWAARLAELGVAADEVVALCMDRSFEMVVAVLAVLKAGAGYLPLDPGYPPERLAFMLEDSGARAVLTRRHLADRLPAPGDGAAHPAAVIVVEDLPAEGGGARIDAVPGNLAYLIYTSGSTGRPKGVAMPHAPLANLVAWQVRRSDLLPGAATLQFASLSFDVSFQEIFSTLCAGGVLVLLDEERRRDPAAVLRLLDEAQVARLFLPFVALQQLAEQARHAEEPPRALREVITAGEQLHVTPEIRALFGRLGARLYNQYGPSESHVVTELALDGAAASWPAMPTIGRPLPNVTVHVFDRAGRTCPIGIPGEACLGGLALARGYAGRAALTAERFTVDPEGATPGCRLYRTGDRARYLEDSTIQFLGRLDDQVKVRGFRVEPGEVEARLREHPGVMEAAVVARAGDRGEFHLEAFVKPDQDRPPTVEKLRAHLAARVPEHMVPSFLVLLEDLPLTPSGKLDRRALPAAVPAAVREAAAGDEPQTPVQEALAAIWCDILQVPHVAADHDFFELGGHSLLATRVISRIRDELGVQLPVREMFEKPTLAALALAVVEAALSTEQDEETLRFLAELEAMSDDEARTLVGGEAAAAG